MSTFLDLVAQVKADANKGSSLDSAIRSRVYMAVQWIEQNYTFEYMKRFGTIYIEPNSNDPGPYALPDNIKAIKLVRTVKRGLDRASSFTKLTKIDPEQETSWGRGPPSGYWLDGMQWMWFDSVPTERTEVQMRVHTYTGMPVDTTRSWIYDNGYQAILGKTMILLGSYARQPAWETMYASMFNQGIQALILADEEMQRSDTEERMGSAQYGR